MDKIGGNQAENYEHILMCLICRNLFDDYDHQPKFLPCHHTFCKECLGEYLSQFGDEIECPSCRAVASIPAAGVAALQTNFYIKHIQSLLGGKTDSNSQDTALCCSIHPQQSHFVFCVDCRTAVCSSCLEATNGDSNGVSKDAPSSDGQKQLSKSLDSAISPIPEYCLHNLTRSLSKVTEESHQKLHSTFSKSTTVLEKKKTELKGLLRLLSDEKDEALKTIDSSFEQHVHTLQRRGTLLKNNVIDIFGENVKRLESDIMEISTAVTCIVSLKELQESRINRGELKDFEASIAEINKVTDNIESRVKVNEHHIVYDGHGVEKFQVSVKDLGRVKCVQPKISVEPAKQVSENTNGETNVQNAKLKGSSVVESTKLNGSKIDEDLKLNGSKTDEGSKLYGSKLSFDRHLHRNASVDNTLQNMELDQMATDRFRSKSVPYNAFKTTNTPKMNSADANTISTLPPQPSSLPLPKRRPVINPNVPKEQLQKTIKEAARPKSTPVRTIRTKSCSFDSSASSVVSSQNNRAKLSKQYSFEQSRPSSSKLS